MSALLDRAAETAAVEGVLGAVLAILLRRHGLYAATRTARWPATPE